MNLLGGKRFFPNQETWPKSRFYSEFQRSTSSLETPSSFPRIDTEDVSTGGSVTTLFTIMPLDSSATNFAEMKVQLIAFTAHVLSLVLLFLGYV